MAWKGMECDRTDGMGCIMKGMVCCGWLPLVLLNSDALLEVEEEEAEEEGEEDEVGVGEMGLGGEKGTQGSDAVGKREGTSKKAEGVVENGVRDGRGAGGKVSGKGKGRLKGVGAKRGPKPKAINFHGSDDDYD